MSGLRATSSGEADKILTGYDLGEIMSLRLWYSDGGEGGREYEDPCEELL